MGRRIKRYGFIVRLEHWMVAFSGIMLIFTGLGCLPLFKRYYITEIPGFQWTANFLYLDKIALYLCNIFRIYGDISYLLSRIETRFWTSAQERRLCCLLKMILASFGLAKEPPSDKWLSEKRWAYVVIGITTLIVLFTGIIKVLKNLEWIYFGPKIESTIYLLHTILGGLFILLFFIHVFFVLAVKANWPLLKAMLTGYVDEDYVKHRHAIWYEKIKKNS
jgi:cytochrome b subunit of formate dehydrogenase